MRDQQEPASGKDVEAQQGREWLKSEWLDVLLMSMGDEKKKWGWS